MRQISICVAILFIFTTHVCIAGENLGDCLEEFTFLEKSMTPKSIKACTKIIQDSRQPVAIIAKAYHYRGNAYTKKSNAANGRELNPGVLRKTDADMRQARSDYNEAIRLDPTQFWVYNDLAFTYDLLNDHGPRVEIYTRAIPADPTLAYKYRAEAYLAIGNRSAAIADFNEHLKGRPTDTDVLQSRASAYLLEKNYEAAIADYDAALKQDPSYAHGYQERGRAYADMGNHRRAVQDYDEAARLPGMIATGLLYYYRAESYEKLGDLGAAIADYERAIKIDPDYGAAKIALSNVRKRLGFKR